MANPTSEEQHISVELEPQEARVDRQTTTASSPERAQANETFGWRTYLRLASGAFAFFVAGVNDGSIGALIPYIIRAYAIDTSTMSSVYGTSLLGWFLAAITQTTLYQHSSRGTMLVIGAALQILAQGLRAWKPPFPVFACTFSLMTLGQAYQDTQVNTFAAGVRGAHRWLGLVHGVYAMGCLVAPFIATAIASSQSPSRWELFYWCPFCLSVLNLVLASLVFPSALPLAHTWCGRRAPMVPDEQQTRHDPGGDDERHAALHLMSRTLQKSAVWLLSLFYLFYLGACTTATGWMVEYLVVVRHGDLSKMGYVPSGFNGGSFLGRCLLVIPIHHFGERWTVFLCILLAVALELVFWLVPDIAAASASISLLGLFTGPLFPVGMSIATKAFPDDICQTAMSFLFVIAQIVLQPVLVALLTATAVSWLLVPHPKSTGNSALHQE